MTADKNTAFGAIEASDVTDAPPGELKQPDADLGAAHHQRSASPTNIDAGPCGRRRIACS